MPWQLAPRTPSEAELQQREAPEAKLVMGATEGHVASPGSERSTGQREKGLVSCCHWPWRGLKAFNLLSASLTSSSPLSGRDSKAVEPFTEVRPRCPSAESTLRMVPRAPKCFKSSKSSGEVTPGRSFRRIITGKQGCLSPCEVVAIGK